MSLEDLEDFYTFCYTKHRCVICLEGDFGLGYCFIDPSGVGYMSHLNKYGVGGCGAGYAS